jgi:heat shock protein HslJ
VTEPTSPVRRQRDVRTHAVFALTLALVAAGCILGGSPVSVDGHDFLSTAVTQGGVARPLVDGTRIRIGFADGRISASAGCNSMGGSYRVDGGLLVLDGGLAMTEMGCDPPRHAQDDWLAAFLASRPALRLSGNELALEGGGTVIRLLDREVADPDLPLVGTLWTVDSIITGDAVSSVPDGVVATLRFTGDGQVAIQTGCNQGGGRAAADATTIRFNEIVVTEMACGGPEGAMEAAVFAVVQTAAPVSYEIEAGRLTLIVGANGLGLQGE